TKLRFDLHRFAVWIDCGCRALPDRTRRRFLTGLVEGADAWFPLGDTCGICEERPHFVQWCGYESLNRSRGPPLHFRCEGHGLHRGRVGPIEAFDECIGCRAKAAEDIRDQAAGLCDEFPENGGSVARLAFAAGFRDEVPSATSPLVPIRLMEHDAPGLGERRLDAE